MPHRPTTTAERATTRQRRVVRSSADEVADHIKELVLAGALSPGSRVPQDDIAAELGVSRIPVREALFRLEREGWIENRPHRGAYVHPIDEAWVRDHFELYGFVYGVAVRRAVAAPDADRIAVQLLLLAQRLDPTDDGRAFSRAGGAFNDAVIDAARSPRVRAVRDTLSTIVPDLFCRAPEAKAVCREGQLAVARAAAAGDADGAAEAYFRLSMAICSIISPLVVPGTDAAARRA